MRTIDSVLKVIKHLYGAGPFGLVAKYMRSINTVVGDRMAISSFKGVNQVLDVVSGLASVEATTVYPRSVLIVTSSGSLRLGDGSTAGGAAVGTASSVAFADITGVPGRDNTQSLVGGLNVKPGFGIRLVDANGDAVNRSVAGTSTPDVYDKPSDTLTASNVFTNNLTVDTGNLGIAGRVTAIGGFKGDLTGSVVADDSTVIIDGVAGTVAASTIVGDLGRVGAPQFLGSVPIRVNDVWGAAGDGYTDLPMTQDMKIEIFDIRQNVATPATAHAVDLPDAGGAYGKEVFIYSSGGGSAGNNIIVTFTRMNNGTTEKTSRTFSGNAYGQWSFRWMPGAFWKEYQIV